MSNSNTAVTQSRGRGRGRGGGPPRGGAPRIVERVPASLCTSGTQNVKCVNSSGMPGESFVVFVGGEIPSSITYHRPIGVTPLGSDEWVATPTEELPLLLSRAQDPRLKAVQAAYEAHLLNQAVVANHLVRREGVVFLPGNTTLSRADITAAAEAAAKAKLAAGRNPKASEIVEEFPSSVKDQEKVLRTFLSSEVAREAARAAHPLPRYETVGGLRGDRKQTGDPRYKGKSQKEVRDMIVRSLFPAGEQRS